MIHENTLVDQITLDGVWTVEHNGDAADVQVPGVWDLQGFADVAGPLHYKRRLNIPAEWAQQHVRLDCEAVSYYTEVWLNGQRVGSHEGLWTPFSIDLTAAVRFGQENDLEMRITKPGYDGSDYPYREVLVGFIPYVALTFGGPWQSLRLSAHSAPAWERIHLLPDWSTGNLHLRAQLTAPQADAHLTVNITDAAGEQVSTSTRNLAADETTLSLTLAIPDHHAWSPAAPYLYQLDLTLHHAGQAITRAQRRFGFRQLMADGDHLLLNGQPVHLRGVLSWGWNPTTLSPTFTDDEIRAEFQRIRDHGFNLVKLCLFVPPPRFYEIADEEGLLLWLELPMWLPRLTDHLRQQAHAEYQEIMARDQHHPSLVIYSLGCELGADMADAALLSDLDALVRSAITGALVCDNSGSGEAYKGLTFDFADFNDYHFYSDLHYFNPLLQHFQRDWRPVRPWIFGEFCDKDDYRHPDDLLENGARPWWCDLFGIEGNITRWAYPVQEQRMAAHDLPFTDEQISAISRQESLLFRKFILEQTRLRRAIGGYVITGLRDTPISTSGIFDDRNQPKYDPETFSTFNADAVLVLEGSRTRIWQHGGDRPAPIDRFNYPAGEDVDLRVVLAHTGLSLEETNLTWEIYATGSGDPIFSGEQRVTLSANSPAEIARINFTVPALSQAEAWQLYITLEGIAANQWTLWCYPAQADLYAGVNLYDPSGSFGPEALTFTPDDRLLLTTLLTAEIQAWIAAGGRALLLNDGGGGLPVEHVPFWRESIKLLYTHPVLDAFPHDGYADLQFYHLATDCAFATDKLAQAVPELTAIRPLIRRLDARLFTLSDYLVELSIGRGKLLASTLHFNGGAGDQVTGLNDNPAAQHLLATMIAYLKG